MSPDASALVEEDAGKFFILLKTYSLEAEDDDS
jgi:hypothetical protein